MTSSLFWAVTQSARWQLFTDVSVPLSAHLLGSSSQRNARNNRKNGHVGAGVGVNWFSESVNKPIMLNHGEKRSGDTRVTPEK